MTTKSEPKKTSQIVQIIFEQCLYTPIAIIDRIIKNIGMGRQI